MRKIYQPRAIKHLYVFYVASGRSFFQKYVLV